MKSPLSISEVVNLQKEMKEIFTLQVNEDQVQ